MLNMHVFNRFCHYWFNYYTCKHYFIQRINSQSSRAQYWNNISWFSDNPRILNQVHQPKEKIACITIDTSTKTHPEIKIKPKKETHWRFPINGHLFSSSLSKYLDKGVPGGVPRPRHDARQLVKNRENFCPRACSLHPIKINPVERKFRRVHRVVSKLAPGEKGPPLPHRSSSLSLFSRKRCRATRLPLPRTSVYPAYIWNIKISIFIWRCCGARD